MFDVRGQRDALAAVAAPQVDLVVDDRAWLGLAHEVAVGVAAEGLAGARAQQVVRAGVVLSFERLRRLGGQRGGRMAELRGVVGVAQVAVAAAPAPARLAAELQVDAELRRPPPRELQRAARGARDLEPFPRAVGAVDQLGAVGDAVGAREVGAARGGMREGRRGRGRIDAFVPAASGQDRHGQQRRDRPEEPSHGVRAAPARWTRRSVPCPRR